MKTLTILAFVLVVVGCGKIGQTDAKLSTSSPFFNTLSKFVTQARARGVEIEAQTASIQISFAPLAKPTLARCTRPLIGDRFIEIDPIFFREYPEAYIESTLFHELGHCVLNRDHSEGQSDIGEPTSVMNSTGPDGNEFRRNFPAYMDELFSKH